MIDKMMIDKLEAMPIEGVAEQLGMRVERHKALCPWHDDRRPSLTFNAYKNRYRCFVCDAHGGVIDLVMKVRGCNFREACEWLNGGDITQRGLSLLCKNDRLKPASPQQENPAVTPCEHGKPGEAITGSKSPSPSPTPARPLDMEWLTKLVSVRYLNEEARRFLFEERKIDPRVAEWCGLTSISQSTPCWRYGKPFYDAPSLLIPYYDEDGRLVSVQGRYLGPLSPDCVVPSPPKGKGNLHKRDSPLCVNSGRSEGDIPRFKFPRGSNCHVYGRQILRLLEPGEELWITEGCSDCWAMLSSGKKAIAIPSATLLKEKDLEPLKGLNLHMYPDQDRPGERLFLELRARLPQLVRHQLPEGCKDFGDYWKKR